MWLQDLNEDSTKAYRLLEKRIAREKQLLVAQQKMEVKIVLQVNSLVEFPFKDKFFIFLPFGPQNKKQTKPKRIAPGTKNSAPVYKWKTERKRWANGGYLKNSYTFHSLFF